MSGLWNLGIETWEYLFCFILLYRLERIGMEGNGMWLLLRVVLTYVWRCVIYEVGYLV